MVRLVLYIQEGLGLNLNTEISYPEDSMISLKTYQQILEQHFKIAYHHVIHILAPYTQS
jgi:hypothetical protein